MSANALRIKGPQRLQGTVAVSGAKNACLPCMFASLLTDDKCRLESVPQLGDVATTIRILTSLGKQVSQQKHCLTLSGSSTGKGLLAARESRAMRASILALGPLLATGREAVIPMPGGCDIGSRPIDVHLEGMHKLGASVRVEGGNVIASAHRRLRGAAIALESPSVTGTENLIMAACLASGTTQLTNAACEPEIADLAAMINSMGGRIQGAGTAAVAIEGVSALSGCDYRIMPDRIEAGTYLAALAACGGTITLNNADPAALDAVLAKLENMGVKISSDPVRLQITASATSGRRKAVGFETASYPGFPTDLQAQLMAANCVASGRAVIVERIFERRFRHADELVLLGADIKIRGNQALVTGVSRLSAANVAATDLRASASLVIAALAANGHTTIRGLHHIDRGYDDLSGKLRSLGASVRKVKVADHTQNSAG